MNINSISALAIRVIGAISIIFGLLILISIAIAYATANYNLHHDVAYFLYDGVISGSGFIVVGILLFVFSKRIGRLLARGLE